MIKILQVMTAENWWALYEEDGEPFLNRLVCWALVQVGNEDIDRSVTGMDVNIEGKIEFCQDIENFKAYIYAKSEEEANQQIDKDE
jgi:hypothetical protein